MSETSTTSKPVSIIGGGLAGCEIALQLARRGIPSRLHEMKPGLRTPAQVSDEFAELVCSNSLRGVAIENAVGALKEEMRLLGGALIQVADETSVPAGGALAVDREVFSHQVGELVRSEELITVVRGEVTDIPSVDVAPDVVVATGPLTSPVLSQRMSELCGGSEYLYFYDAIAPIVSADSVDMTIAYRASRYAKGEGDEYLNLPLDKDAYEALVKNLLESKKVAPRDFEEERYFEGCLPVEVLATRGFETLRYGCMKPVGLPDPRTGEEPYAVVQLRPENREHTAYNMVGFQTRMKWGEQGQVFRQIPGLAKAEFLRMGSIHRNTYIDSPRLLDDCFRLRNYPHIIFAGQVTGVEGYVESMACGLLVAFMLIAQRRGFEFIPPPHESTMGALHAHILGRHRSALADKHPHVPSNIHWGLTPALNVRARKRDRKRLMGERALEACQAWWRETSSTLRSS